MKHKILIVDDKPVNIKILMEILEEDYAIVGATNGKKALELASKKPSPDLILLDVNMPNMNGFDIYTRLIENPETESIPVIFITAHDEVNNESKGLSLGAADYITKPIVPFLLQARVKNNLELYTYRKQLETMVSEQTRHLVELNDEIEKTLLESLQTLGEIAEVRSEETGQHVKRVMEYSYLMATLLKMKKSDCDLIYQASSMHDIGKMAIPDSILQKPGKLSAEEFEIMKKHAEYGHRMLKNSDRETLKAAATVALSHHEKWNGKGYPNGLSGEDIPLFGRIVALADVLDALGSDRCYKKAWNDERIFEHFKKERGKHFDPKIIDLFFENLGAFLKIRDTFKD